MFVKIVEFLPVIAFFVSYKLTSNMILATAIVVGSCIAATVLEYCITRTVSRMQVFLVCAVILFGLPTVLLNDPEIIKWKVTVVNLILAGAIFFCKYVLKKNPFSYLFGKEIPLPDAAWNSLATMWMIFFVLAAGLNVVIAFCLPSLTGITYQEAESCWVNYKTFGNAALNFIFALGCAFWLLKSYPEVLEEAGLNSKDSSDKDKN